MSDEVKFRIKASSVKANWGSGEYCFLSTLPIPGGQGTAGHNIMELRTDEAELREKIDEVFKLGALYEVTIRKVGPCE